MAQWQPDAYFWRNRPVPVCNVAWPVLYELGCFVVCDSIWNRDGTRRRTVVNLEAQ